MKKSQASEQNVTEGEKHFIISAVLCNV